MRIEEVVSPKVLIIDDEKPICDTLSASLKDDGFGVEYAIDGKSGLEKIEKFKPDVILLDVWMPGSLDGLDVIRIAREKNRDLDFIVMSGHGNIETAVKATRLGAWDFVEKPLSMEKITIGINNVLSFRKERQEKDSLLKKLRRNVALVGESPQVAMVREFVSRMAPSRSWVLLQGQSGVGKEIVAQNIHMLSPRAISSFVDMNCSAIPSELLEGELFGFEKGAFTASTSFQRGKLELCHQGTLFLDEITSLSLEVQGRLVEFFKTQKATRFKGSEAIPLDVRIIGSTSKDLQAEVVAGRFSSELFQVFSSGLFVVPTLKDRIADIPALVTHFSEMFAKSSGFPLKSFSPDAIQLISEYNWPGNVRELKNFIERLYILTQGNTVTGEDILIAGLRVTSDEEISPYEASSFKLARAQFEKEYIIRKLEENSGNVSRTAETIGLERSHLHRKIKAYGIES